MSNIDIIRAWKNQEYRESLSQEILAQLPKNPAGAIELSDLEMSAIAGGFNASTYSEDCMLPYTKHCIPH
jgi:mersacidin/lichenicidin family type 2 lantibiotic